MNEQLLLENIRNVLARLEETIIFGLIERAQFRHNATIYSPGAFGEALGEECLVDFLLHECERSHAKVRRYTSPDEHPFFTDLPDPVLPALSYAENPLRPNRINLNPRIRMLYQTEIVSRICEPGDDQQYGSSAVCDVACLQALSRRIHYGKFVAESKYRQAPGRFDPLICAQDREALLRAISDEPVEAQVLKRVEIKARTYGQDPVTRAATPNLDPQAVVDTYATWIIPLNKEVQVLYLMGRKEPCDCRDAAR